MRVRSLRIAVLYPDFFPENNEIGYENFFARKGSLELNAQCGQIAARVPYGAHADKAHVFQTARLALPLFFQQLVVPKIILVVD